MKAIRIGCGAGYSGDRIDPAVELASSGNLDYLVFECLAERTIAMAQLAKMKDPSKGYDPLLKERFSAVLPYCIEKGIKIITNMGAANPLMAAKAVAELGFKGLKIAYVLGDEVLDKIPYTDKNISANAYLGVEPIVEALQNGADIVITGRVGDPALFLAPMIYQFGWDLSDYDLLGKGTLIGHLLECSSQVTGGYFADLNRKNVPNLARIGFPIAEVKQNGSVIISKVEGSGGLIDLRTCKEQLLYEVHDPAAYIQPDVVADFSSVTFKQEGVNKVSAHGATGTKRPTELKVTIGYHDGFIGEGAFSYYGYDAKARGDYAIALLKERFDYIGLKSSEMRYDLLVQTEPSEVRLRVIGRTETFSEANKIGLEVESLWLNGAYGGGGAYKNTREVIAVNSTFIPRENVTPSVHYEVTE